MSSFASQALPDDDDSPLQVNYRRSLATGVLEELGKLEQENERVTQENEKLNQQVEVAKAEVAKAEAKAEVATAEVEEANKKVVTAMSQVNSVLRRQLSVLPHFNRYTRAGNTTLETDDPMRALLQIEFLNSLTKHRGPTNSDPHRAKPVVSVTRIERIRVPRLQEKYLVELQAWGVGVM